MKQSENQTSQTKDFVNYALCGSVIGNVVLAVVLLFTQQIDEQVAHRRNMRHSQDQEAGSKVTQKSDLESPLRMETNRLRSAIEPAAPVAITVFAYDIYNNSKLLNPDLTLSETLIKLLSLSSSQVSELENVIASVHRQMQALETNLQELVQDKDGNSCIRIPPYPEGHERLRLALQEGFRSILGSSRAEPFVDVLANEKPLGGGLFETEISIDYLEDSTDMYECVALLRYGDSREMTYSARYDRQVQIEGFQKRYGHLTNFETVLDALSETRTSGHE